MNIQRRHLLIAAMAILVILSIWLVQYIAHKGPAPLEPETGFLDTERYRNPGGGYDLDMLFRLTTISYEEGRYEEAIVRSDWLSGLPRMGTEMAADIAFLAAESCQHLLRQAPDRQESCASRYIKAWDIAPGSARTPLILMRLAEGYLLVDDPLDAEKTYARLAADFPHSPFLQHIPHYWGNYYFDANAFDKAAEHLWTHFSLRPDSIESRQDAPRLAVALSLIKDHARILDLMDFIHARWQDMDARMPELQRIEGDAALALGMKERALQAMLAYVNITPNAAGVPASLDRLAELAPAGAQAIQNYARGEEGSVSSGQDGTVSFHPFLVMSGTTFLTVHLSCTGINAGRSIREGERLRHAIYYYLSHKAASGAFNGSDPEGIMASTTAVNGLVSEDGVAMCTLEITP